jgi:hypothetical protein
MRPTVAVFDFRTINCPEPLGRELADILRDELSVRYDFKIIKTAISGESIKCHTIQDATEYGRRLNADKSIIGSVNVMEKGDDEKSSKISREAYFITVRIVSVKTGREEGHYTKTCNRVDLRRWIIATAKELRTRERDSTFDEALHGEYEESIIDRLALTGISVSAVYAKPQGDFSEMADGGYGFNLSIYSSIVPLRGSSLMLSLEYHVFNENAENVESLQMASATLSLGYSFSLTRYVSLFPVAGFGYVAHIVDGNRDGTGTERSYYFDPSVSAGLEISFILNQDYHVFFMTSYALFFEEDDAGQYIGTSIGVKILF